MPVVARPPRISTVLPTASAPEIRAVAPTPLFTPLPQANQAKSKTAEIRLDSHITSPSPAIDHVNNDNDNANVPLTPTPTQPAAASPREQGKEKKQKHSPISPSSSLRSPTRPLSPDLPNRDALYLFANFSSYMRSPHEASEGVRADDFRDTIRLLDHARLLASQPEANVHILHLKYRFQGPATTFRSPYATGDHHLPVNYRDAVGRLRNPVPQPFSVLHDPVVKIDYLENGVFDPLPAQAVWAHIAKMCQPPPRVIVMSYVYSKVTENHLASLSTWAMTSTPPACVFSPLETRIRERRPLHLALHHAIPMSMYAWPADTEGAGTSSPFSPLSAVSPFRGAHAGAREELQGEEGRKKTDPVQSPGPGRKRSRSRSRSTAGSPILLTRRLSGSASPTDIVDRYTRPSLDQASARAQAQEQRQTPDPVASLTIITSSSEDEKPTQSVSMGQISSPSAAGSGGSMPVDRIPLWHLAPGVGVLHGSTSASIGVRLCDFSALNLANESRESGKGIQPTKTLRSSEAEDLGIRTSPMKLRDLAEPFPSLLEQPISRPPSTTPAAVGIPSAPPNADAGAQGAAAKITHLTPPELGPRSLALAPSTTSQSWPAPISKVPGWRKGRKEMMEDILDELGSGPTEERDTFRVDQVVRRVAQLGQVDEEPKLDGCEACEGRERELGGNVSLLDLLIGQ